MSEEYADDVRRIALVGIALMGATVGSAVTYTVSPTRLGAFITTAFFVALILTRATFEYKRGDLA